MTEDETRGSLEGMPPKRGKSRARQLLSLGSIVILSAATIIAMTTIGRAPTTPSGPMAISFDESVLRIGRTPETTIDVVVGLYRPRERPPGQGRLPLVIYLPGWGDHYDDNRTFVANIASRGFAVLALHDIVHDPKAAGASADDEAARSARFDIETEDRQIQFVEDADRRAGLAALKVSAVLDAIFAARGKDPRFADIEAERVGVVGASFGGATASEAAIIDSRVAIAINLDGLVFGRAAGEVIPRPYIEFNSTIGVVPVDEAASTDVVRRFLARANIQQIARQQRQLSARRDAYEITLRGMRHEDFTRSLYDPRRVLSWRPWRDRLLAPHRAREIIDTIVIGALSEWLTMKYGAFTQLDWRAFPEAAVEKGRGR